VVLTMQVTECLVPIHLDKWMTPTHPYLQKSQ
jgi:hypothetical protein